MKTLKKVIITVSIGFTLILLAGFCLIEVYEDEIKAYALKELGNSLTTEVHVEELELTVWDQFPQASLQFQNVLIEETFEEKDTLIYAENLYLNFDLTDFISGNYKIKGVTLVNGKANFKRTKTGEDNYHFWKSSDSENSDFSLNIQGIELENTHFTLNDEKAAVQLSLASYKSKFDGSFGSENADIYGHLDTQVHFLDVEKKSYLANQRIEGNIELGINILDEIYDISDAEVLLNGLPLDIKGSIELEQETTALDLNVKTKNGQLNQVIANLPMHLRTHLNRFDASGTLTAQVNVFGEVSSNKNPEVTSSYTITDGKLSNKETGVGISKLKCSGSYAAPPGKEDFLQLSKFSFAFGDGNYLGEGKVSRLSKPFINAKIKGSSDLEAFRDFLNLEHIETISGNTQIELAYKGNLNESWQPTSSNLRHADLSGKVKVADAKIKLTDHSLAFENLAGELLFSEGSAAINNFNVNYGQSDFALNGFFRNVLEYALLPDEKLEINCSVNSKFIDLNSIFSSSETTSVEDSEYELNLPDYIDAELNANIENLVFREFAAKNITAKNILNSKELRIAPLSMECSGGQIRSDISAKLSTNGNFTVRASGNINKVDISTLFASFENFQQEFITEDHLRGRASSEFDFSVVMDKSLNLNPASAELTANISLKNGELINHQSLLELGAYMKDKKVLSAFTDMQKFNESLKHVHFSELSNEIRIKNETITIPKMAIESDALDIKASGTHTFNNEIDYSVGFDVADLSNREGLTEEERGLSKNIFIAMTGTTDQPEFSYDRMAVKEERRENRKEEKQQIKSILKSEFSKKKDLPKQPNKEDKSRVTVIWNESSDSSNSAGIEFDNGEEEEEDDF